MESAIVIDLAVYLNQSSPETPSCGETHSPCSELGMAIERLIQQMRESNSLKSTG